MLRIVRSAYYIFASQGFLVHFAPQKRLWGMEWTENPWLAKMPHRSK